MRLDILYIKVPMHYAKVSFIYYCTSHRPDTFSKSADVGKFKTTAPPLYSINMPPQLLSFETTVPMMLLGIDEVKCCEPMMYSKQVLY